MGRSAEFSLGAEANIWVSSAHKRERSPSDFTLGTTAAAASRRRGLPPFPGRDEARIKQPASTDQLAADRLVSPLYLMFSYDDVTEYSSISSN